MNVSDCILTRRSVRSYLRKEVDRETLGKVLEAGRAAPSAGNIQPWFFIVVDDPAKIKGLAASSYGQDWMAQAPQHIVVCGKPLEVKRNYGIRGERLYLIQDCAAATQNMLLQAHALGLGACWVGAFDEDKVRNILGIVEEIRPQAIITLGYAAEQPLPPAKRKLDNVVFFNKWWGRIKDLDVFMGYSMAAKAQRLVQGTKGVLDTLKKKVQK